MSILAKLIPFMAKYVPVWPEEQVMKKGHEGNFLLVSKVLSDCANWLNPVIVIDVTGCLRIKMPILVFWELKKNILVSYNLFSLSS